MFKSAVQIKGSVHILSRHFDRVQEDDKPVAAATRAATAAAADGEEDDDEEEDSDEEDDDDEVCPRTLSTCFLCSQFSKVFIYWSM